MKSTIVFLAIISAVPVALIAQDARPYSQLVLVNTAEILPHMTLSANAGTSLYTKFDKFYRGYLTFAFANVAEISLSREGTMANAFGALEAELSWALKLRVLTASDDQPAIALRIQSSLGWGSHKVWSTDIESFSRNLFQRGLWDTHYEVNLTTFQVLLSHKLAESFSLHTAVGMYEIQTRNLFITLFLPPDLIGSHARDIEQQLLLCGSLGVAHEVNSQLSLLFEIQSIPALWPDIDGVKINANRGYVGSLAFRYLPLPVLGLDGGIVFHAAPNTTDYTEVRLGLNTSLSLQ